MLNLIIQTQYKENYAAHNEDYVHGVSKPYWKFKGGSSYLITDIDFLNTEYLEGLIEETKFLHSYENEGSMEYVLNWELIDENDVSNHMSEWESPYILEKNSDGFWESSKVTENGDYGYMIEDILRKKETWVYTENGVDGVSKYTVSYELVDGTVCGSNEELGAYLEEKEKMLNLNDYLCPDHESGLYKGIPMEYRNAPVIQEILKTRLFTVRYRGTSKVGYARPAFFCHKDYADTFAIYPYANYDEYQTKDDYLGLERPKYDPVVRNYEHIREFRDEHTRLTCEVADAIVNQFVA